MSTVRRRVLRQPKQVSTVTDLRKARRSARQRERLEKDRVALKRWLTRLKRAANTVTELHQRIARVEAAIEAAD
jgi:spore germination cell wall hydrolase CwlJ-like protein